MLQNQFVTAEETLEMFEISPIISKNNIFFKLLNIYTTRIKINSNYQLIKPLHQINNPLQIPAAKEVDSLKMSEKSPIKSKIIYL